MTAALVIVNLIEDLAGIKGRANACYSQVVERNIVTRVNAATAYARVRKIPVIWSRIQFGDDYQAMPAHSLLFTQMKLIGALRAGSAGSHWLENVNVQQHDEVFEHRGLSAFTGNNLLAWLHQHKRQHLLIAGISSCLTIESTVREAHERGIDVTVLEDICAAESLLAHQQSMENLQRFANISSTRLWTNG
ncbi:isochorismatase [[Pantoea] beijingensis]|uniref:Isochorismatase n=1 Tax=[Pantoea] beijingensis TaxID=1324864 RepID=A0A443IDR6_9GAMM|nr:MULTISPECIES: cysteine hydrolase [Erwiniaceae]RWR02183.1 isochorismatase [[Pantoea] beijingensis]